MYLVSRTRKKNKTKLSFGVSKQIQFSRTALAQSNMWFVKRKNMKIDDEKSHPWMAT